MLISESVFQSSETRMLHTHTIHTGRALTSFDCIKCSNPQLWMERVICNRYHRCASPMHWIYNHSLGFDGFFFLFSLLHIIRLFKCGQFMIVSLVKMQVISSLLACTACAYMLMTSKANHNIQLFTLENQEFIDSIVYFYLNKALLKHLHFSFTINSADGTGTEFIRHHQRIYK